MFDFLSEKFSSIFTRLTGQHKLTESNIAEALEKVRHALLEADVPQHVVETFLQELSTQVMGQKVLSSLKPGEQLIKIVHDKLVQFLGGQSVQAFSFQLPSVVMVMGLQGAGKTTLIAKLAQYINQQAQERGKKRKILVASVDFYRPAAIDQLEILANAVQVDFYRSSLTDPVKAAQECYTHYKKNSYDLLLLDTAGRLHVDSTMLEQLREINQELEPKYKILVLDAMTGQESLRVAQAFQDSVGFDGAVLTKLDSDTRAGAAFAFKYMLKKPVLFVGTGEKVADLEHFRPERMASRILGMGDIQTLIEKANKSIEQTEQRDLEKSFMSGKMNLVDFAKQLEMMSRLGSLSQIAKFIPGMSSLSVTPEMMEKGEKEMKQFKAIISSMTPKERYYPKILDSSRKERIAKGCGLRVNDVNNLLKRFEQSLEFAKLFKKSGRMLGF